MSPFIIGFLGFVGFQVGMIFYSVGYHKARKDWGDFDYNCGQNHGLDVGRTEGFQKGYELGLRVAKKEIQKTLQATLNQEQIKD